MHHEPVVEPLSPTFGAVVHGVDGRRPLDAHEVERLSGLLITYKVLFFRAQSLSNDEQLRFMAHFGEGRVDPMERTLEGYPGLAVIDNVPLFHADWMHAERPPRWSMLQMREVPDVGGDTMWADLVGSYRALSAPMRGLLETLTVEQRHPLYDGDGSALAQSYVDQGHLGTFEQLLELVQPRTQPLVRFIEESGACNYWISRAFTRRINELLPGESDALLGFLFAHQLRPEHVLRWRWQRGDIAFWDHRTTLHSGIKDYGDLPRMACRATTCGGPVIPVPVGPAGGSGSRSHRT